MKDSYRRETKQEKEHEGRARVHPKKKKTDEGGTVREKRSMYFRRERTSESGAYNDVFDLA